MSICKLFLQHIHFVYIIQLILNPQDRFYTTPFLSFRNIGFLSCTLWSRNIGINLWQYFGIVDCKNNHSPQKYQQSPGIKPGHHRCHYRYYLHPISFPCSSCSKMGLARIHVQSPTLCAKYVCQCANSESHLDCKRQVCTVYDYLLNVDDRDASRNI